MFKTIELKKNYIRIIDQTKLPTSLQYVNCPDLKSLWWAIKKLKVRGAPALGVAGAFGVALAMKKSQAKTLGQFRKELIKAVSYLESSRPTAVNLSWALNRMYEVFNLNQHRSLARIRDILLKEAMEIYQEDRQLCRNIGKQGSRLIKSGNSIMTICNAGALATSDYGTALAVFYKAKEKKKKFKVFALETRPLLQGARLTTWELKKNNIDVALICDNMAATVMKQRKVDMIITGADRIAANGDAANKIGTYNLAVLADYHKIPFFIAAPSSTFDLNIKSGKEIPIEERDPQEIFTFAGKRIAAEGIKAFNPAFDVTPHELIKGIITDKGIIRPPYKRNIVRILKCTD